MPEKMTIYPDTEMFELIDRMRAGPPIQSRSKLALQLIEDGLPSKDKLELNRARRAKREDLRDD